MQCQSYFPVCHSHYDLNGDANGGARPVYNSNGSLRNRHFNNYVSSSPIPPQGHYGKEFLRQTMLVQELTFRDQVQELHRLYRRQKELMSEIRNKEIFTSRLPLEAQCSNSFSKFLPNRGQNSQNNLHLPDSFQDQRIVDANVPKDDSNNKNNLQFVESKCKKVGGKLLDLELPAEVYIDIEDQESLEDAQLFEIPTSASSSNKSNPNLADLNKPLIAPLLDDTDKIPKNVKILERSPHTVNQENDRSDTAFLTPESDTTDADKAKHVSVGSCQETRSNNMVKNGLVVQALPCSTNQVLPSKGAKRARIKALIVDDDEIRPLKSIACKSKLKESVVRHGNGFNCIDLNSAVSNAEAVIEVNRERINGMHLGSNLVSVLDSETTRKIKKCRLIDINLPCEPNTEDEPLVEDDLDQHDSESLPLNNINDDGSPLKSSKKNKISIKIDLEAPPSPEVEEGPPPREDSEENLPKATLTDDPLLERDKVAAEIIVSMSLSKIQPFPDTRDLRTLEWFADIIHSVSVDPTYGLDDFEAMTLSLTEMKEEEHWCHEGVPSESLTNSTSQSSQTRKGRTSRSKRKDFQREVLPSLTSLSRYEVTEDIQMIEGLMEANGTPWQLCKTRRACRMGRKTRTVEPQSCIADVVDLKCDRALGSWGKVPRRGRGQRSSGNPSKWLQVLM